MYTLLRPRGLQHLPITSQPPSITSTPKSPQKLRVTAQAGPDKRVPTFVQRVHRLFEVIGSVRKAISVCAVQISCVSYMNL